MQHRKKPTAHRGGNLVADLVTLACVAAIVVTTLVLGYAWFDPAHADVRPIGSSAWERATGGASVEATSVGLKQPYGGCREAWQAPHSKGARWCRHHGWTVRARLVLSPHGIVMTTRLPHCREEDGSGQRSACTWNLGGNQTDGDGRGLSYWVGRHDHIHYVWPENPRTDRLDRWVGPQLADALAEGEHQEPAWGRCITNGRHAKVIRVACPDGWTHHA